MAQGRKRKRRGMGGGEEGGRVVVKLNDCFVRIIIDDSGSVNY